MTEPEAPASPPPPDDLSAERVIAELRKLRKGRGVYAAGLTGRVGECLRELASGHAGSPRDVAAFRRLLVTELSACAAQLSEEMRQAVTASLALSEPARNLSDHGDRVAWLAEHIERGTRTAQRRIDAAEALLAEEVVLELRRRRGRDGTTPTGWYLEEFRVVLRLDTPTPQTVEQRRIVVTRPVLHEVMAWLAIPGADRARPGRPPAAEVLYGGRLLGTRQPTPGRFQFVIGLDTPLRAGERHEYGLSLRLADTAVMRPHYIFVPEYQCDLFDLTVRFDPLRRPGWVRRVDGEPVRVFDAAQPPVRGLEISESGEVRARFSRPAQYLGYGLQWQG